MLTTTADHAATTTDCLLGCGAATDDPSGVCDGCHDHPDTELTIMLGVPVAA
jgi:hypothetical protein